MKNKYNAKSCYVDGIRFASMKESSRYKQLKILERTGLICNLELQPRFRISTGGVVDPETGRKMAARVYVADFQYLENGKMIVEDVKGYKKDKTYRLKRQLFLEQYGDKYSFRET